MDLTDYWPKSLAHLALPYDDGISDHVIIAQVSDDPYNGYRGALRMSTALVPLNQLRDILSSPRQEKQLSVLNQ
jgi:hypothetical protein